MVVLHSPLSLFFWVLPFLFNFDVVLASQCKNPPIIFNFGDSNSDTGGLVAGLGFPVNPPNGRTFFHRSTGRLCDGRLVIDFLCQSLNASLLTPYLDSLSGSKFTNGANFAVVGSSTLPKYVPFSLNIQIMQFLHFKARILEPVTAGSGNSINDEGFRNALYMIDIGQNDIADSFGKNQVNMSSVKQFVFTNPQAVVVAVQIVAFCMVADLQGAAQAAPAFFVFGDSIVDSGNNNYLATTARADSPPYGIDYPTHRPTGRFSNGLNFPDIISEQIGSEPVLPYLSPELQGERLLIGANFASAGIGILNDTGIQFVSIIRMYQQFANFEAYQVRLANLIGAERAEQVVNQALVLITVGGNDFVNNYFLPLSLRSRQFSIPDYCRFLISEYRKLLMRLYELGGRRVLVTGTGPLGCVPAELAMQGSRNGECVPRLQEAAGIFNPLLSQMVQGLNSDIGSNVFIFGNSFSMNMNFITQPQSYGFVTSKVACCGQGPYNGLGLCTVVSNLCPNRDIYAFWDPFHPTERANRILVQQLMTGSSEFINPMNLSTFLDMTPTT